MKLKNYMELVEIVDLKKINQKNFKNQYVGCVILTKDLKILLQLRDEHRSFPGSISTFGGKIEVNEEPIQSIVRELYEELGANVNISELVSFGAITDAVSEYTDLIYMYFWHDHAGTILHCSEGSPLYFADIESAMNHPKTMDYVRWGLKMCKDQELT